MWEHCSRFTHIPVRLIPYTFLIAGFLMGGWQTQFHGAVYGLCGLCLGGILRILCQKLLRSQSVILRWLAALVASLAIVLSCSAVGLSTYRYYAKAQAVAQIRERGIKVFDIPMKRWLSVEFHADAENTTPPVHELLLQLQALPPFSLCFTGSGFSDASIAPVINDLQQIPRLLAVSLINTQATSASGRRLQKALPHCWVELRSDPTTAERH